MAANGRRDRGRRGAAARAAIALAAVAIVGGWSVLEPAPAPALGGTGGAAAAQAVDSMTPAAQTFDPTGGVAGVSAAPRSAAASPAVPASVDPGASASAAATPSGPATPSPSPRPVRRPFSMDLYRPGTFVSQIDKEHCMSAAMQNMLNIIGPTVDRTAATQRRIAAIALPLSTDTIDGGWGPQGWADGLVKLGAGTYVVRVFDTRAAALRNAVRALRATGRPVGILSWWGAHSWVLTGFEADADPALFPDAAVTRYRIVDPWYPRVSTIWGAAKPPDSRRTPADMVHNLPAWIQPEGPYPRYDGRWVAIIPVGHAVPRLVASPSPRITPVPAPSGPAGASAPAASPPASSASQ